MELDNDVPVAAGQVLDDVEAVTVQRRVRRPGRRIQHGRQRRVEPERPLDRRTVERSVDEAVDFRETDQRGAVAVRIDEARIGVFLQPIAVREHQAIEARDDRRDAGRRVELVLSGDAVKRMDPHRPARQPRHVPEVGVDVGVELHPARVAAGDDVIGDAGGAKDVAGVPQSVGGREPDLNARVGAQAVEHRPEHGEAHRRRGLEEDAHLRLHRRADRIVHRVNAAHGSRAAATIDRVAHEIGGWARMVSPSDDSVDHTLCRRPPPEDAADHARGGGVDAWSRARQSKCDGFSIRFGGGVHPAALEAGAGELDIQLTAPLANARVAIAAMPRARVGADRRDGVDDELSPLKHLLDGRAQRPAETVDGERHRQVADGMARRDAQPEVPALNGARSAMLVEAARVRDECQRRQHRRRIDGVRAVK